MLDTRNARTALVVGIAAAIGAILGEMFIRPSLTRAIK